MESIIYTDILELQNIHKYVHADMSRNGYHSNNITSFQGKIVNITQDDVQRSGFVSY